jgi:cytochrome P450
MGLADAVDILFLKLTDPTFSIRSQEVREARERSWCARTPYGFAVLRYDDVGKLLSDPRLRQGSHAWPAHNNVTGTFADWWRRILLNRVGKDHARLRRLASPAFSPKLIIPLQPIFADLARDIVGKFANFGRCEFMGEFSEPYVARVVCMLLGFDQTEWRRLADLAGDMGLALGVNFKRDVEKIDAATSLLFEYAYRVVEERRTHPSGDDFISQLLRANEDKDMLNDQELYDMVVLAVFGGIDTTRNQLGLAMSLFVEHPDQWKLLSDRPELARNAVEEVMRVRPTTTWVTREATEDFTYRDLEFKRGTTIHLFSESAGTDPRHFAPNFDIVAERKPHFGFGGGMHHCLGHLIARADMTEALKVLAQRMRNLRYDGEPTWLPDSGNTGPAKLPIAFDPKV